MTEVEVEFPLRGDFDKDLYRDIEFVFICFTNRCGSNFIAETLGSDGQLNVASEWWNGGEILNVMKYQNLTTFREYFTGTCRYNMVNGRLISKLAVENLVLLHHSGFFESNELRCRFLFVERLDKLDQAISLALALDTSAWAFNNVRRIANSEVVYDRTKIDGHITSINEKNAHLNDFFRLNGIEPIRINYEDFLEDPDYHTGLIGEKLGVGKLVNTPATVNVRKQADETNRAWRRLYLDSTADPRGSFKQPSRGDSRSWVWRPD